MTTATFCRQCGETRRRIETNGLCWQCEEGNLAGWHDADEDIADDEPGVDCPACGGTGEAPDNGTNMGECDECCGSGLMA